MQERGSAMLTAIIAVTVLLLISGIVFSFVNNQFKLQTTEEKALRAYYLADAGTSYGIAVTVNALKQGSYTGNPMPPIDVKNPFGTDYRGEFKVTVTVANPNPNQNQVYTITATSEGYYPSKEDKDHILRTLKKEYFFTTMDTPPD
ncbi:hypothetical protein [Desulfosporosinus sp. FKB]|uniref:hypothetical protein n=1 Tax=Desulfosporosinus sp. FKB TaxID=1969835 RepID=UPI000B4971DF|nr:hypothetical protein [Desulfosporosinus sp. FKB]